MKYNLSPTKKMGNWVFSFQSFQFITILFRFHYVEEMALKEKQCQFKDFVRKII